MNDKRIRLKGMSGFDTLLTVLLCIVMPWKWLLLIGAWVSHRNHMCDIEDKIDALSKPQRPTIPYTPKPTYQIDNNINNQIDTIRSYSDERSYLRIRSDS